MRRPRGGWVEYVPLGRGGPDVSAVGLGMWQAGGKSWGSDVRDDDCRKAMERAVELGINLVDTAEAYGDGHSEHVMSRAIRNVGRDRVFVATKVGGQAFLVVIAPKTVSRSVVRKTIRELVAHLASVSKRIRAETDLTARQQRVNVRPPR